MSKYTKIFTTPYVPKYGPVPLSEIGQMMKERKQVIDASILQDEQTMAILDQVSIGLNEDEKNTLLSSVEPYYKDAQSRIQSGDYNLRDIDLQTRRDATRIAGIVQGFQGLKEQKQKDIDNFYKLNKDADPIKLQLMLSELGMPSIKMDEETGLPTLSHSIGNIKIPEFESEQNYGVLEPIPVKNIGETIGVGEAANPRNIGIGDIIGWASPPVSSYNIERNVLKYAAELSEDASILRQRFKESIREARPELTEEQLRERTTVAFENYVKTASQVEGGRFSIYTPDEAKEIKDYYSRDNQIYGHKFFIPSTGERLSIEELRKKYADSVLYGSPFKNIKDFIDNGLSFSGETIDETGQYTLSGSGIVGNLFDGTQFIMDKANVDLMDQETTQISAKLSNPVYMQPIKIKRRGTGNESDILFDLTITKEIVHMLNGERVPPDEEGSFPTIIYKVERNDGKVSTYDSYNEIFNNVISPGQQLR
jgi:hypothetical protein